MLLRLPKLFKNYIDYLFINFVCVHLGPPLGGVRGYLDGVGFLLSPCEFQGLDSNGQAEPEGIFLPYKKEKDILNEVPLGVWPRPLQTYVCWILSTIP